MIDRTYRYKLYDHLLASMMLSRGMEEAWRGSRLRSRKEIDAVDDPHASFAFQPALFADRIMLTILLSNRFFAEIDSSSHGVRG